MVRGCGTHRVQTGVQIEGVTRRVEGESLPATKLEEEVEGTVIVSVCDESLSTHPEVHL